MSSDVWADELPPAGDESQRWAELATKMRNAPGTWCLVAEQSTRSLQQQIRRGVLVAFRPAGHFEAACRRSSSDGLRADVWARYVGEPSCD
jgi:hypothetical protein